MVDNDSRNAELRQRFADVMSGDELQDLQYVFEQVDACGGVGSELRLGPLRPEYRRAPLEDLHAFRLLIDFPSSEPRIWRLVEIRSDARLEWLHHYIQLMFGWHEAGIHRFALGDGGPFSEQSQLFLSSYDDPAAAELNTSSAEEASVRIDEVLQARLDVLHYAYNIVAQRSLTIMLVDSRRVHSRLEPIVVLEGAGDAPPQQYTGPLDDADVDTGNWCQFSTPLANSNLQGQCSTSIDVGVHERLADLGVVMGQTAEGEDCRRRIRRLLDDHRAIGQQELVESLSPLRWFLEKAATEGFTLTDAGYLKPADVEEACREVPRHQRRHSPGSRELHSPEVRRFRDSLTDVGLLVREGRRKLRTSALGDELRHDPWALWSYLSGVLLPTESGLDQDAALLVLLHAATGQGHIDLDEISHALTRAGCRVGEDAIYRGDFTHLPALGILGNLTRDPHAGVGWGFHISGAASILARAALLR